MRPACGARQTPAVASRVRDNAARSDCEMKPVATGCITFTIVLALYASGQVRSHPANSATASVTSRQPRSPGMLMPVMTHVARVIKTRSTAFTAQRITSPPSCRARLRSLEISARNNILKTANPRLFFRMDAGKDGFLQTAVGRGSPSKCSGILVSLGEPLVDSRL